MPRKSVVKQQLWNSRIARNLGPGFLLSWRRTLSEVGN